MPDSQPRNFRVARQINRQDILFGVARVSGSSRLLVASSTNRVIEVDASQANPTGRDLADHGRYATCVRLAGNVAISGGYDGRLIWWDTAEGRVLRTTENAHSRWIRNLAVTGDGTRLASVGDDMVCRLWNARTGERIHELRGHAERTPAHFSSMLYVCVFSPDGTKLATGDRIGHVKIWDVASGRQLSTLDVPVLYTWDGVQRIRSIGGIRGLAFSPDGTQLAVGGVGQIGNVDALQGPSTVEIFNIERAERTQRFTGPNGIVNRLFWHPRNQWVCAVGGGASGLILFWDPTARSMIHQASMPMHVHDAVFDEDFTTLYAVGHQKIAVAELRA